MPANSKALKVVSTLGAGVVVFLLDWLYFSYITAYGLEEKTQLLAMGSINLSIPILLLPVFGVVLLSLVAWYEVATQLFPRRGRPEVDLLARARLFRALAVSFALFLLVLYVPYIIGSNWFWARLSEMSKNISQLRDLATVMLSLNERFAGIIPISQYSLTQILAPGIMVLSAWVFGRVPRRLARQR